jgi:cell division protein FtsI (penicillin-binding protein 3)
MLNQKSIIHRFYFVILLMVLAGIAIVCKAAIIMFAERQYWQDVADRFVKENVVVQPTRGNILSADGQLMASSLPEYKIYMDFKAGGEEKDSLLMLYLDSICDGLHKIFPDKSKEAFKAHIKAGRRKGSRNYLLYPKRISYIQYKQAKALPVFNMRKYKGGFHEEPFNQRKKPFGSLANRTLGDVYADTTLGAKNGLELQYDSVLRGRNGITHRQKVMNKYLNLVDIPPVNGCDLITTIDVSMQDIAEKALVDKLKELGATVGVAILMEVQTGDIKAIVNMTRCSDGEYRELRNNAVSDMMEPGSTFKTASIMVALDDGKITVDDTVDTGCGIYNMHGAKMKDHNWSHGGYGEIDVPHVLMYSSNIGVSRLIDEKYHDHPEDYVNGLYRIGIAQPLGLGIPGSGDPIIRHPNKNNWSKTALAWMSIGYETQIPPISTLTFYNAIANNGVMVRPRLVKSIVKDGETIDENPVEVLIPQIAKPKTIEEIQTILERVVSEGLGRQAGSKQFHVSGKTGTAQVSQGKSGYTNGMRRYLVSFCGYFPSESPKYSCIVAIQKNGLPASGGGMAGPVFRNIAERVYAKHLAQDLMNAKDSTSVLIPDVKRGNIEAANYVLRQIDVPTTGYSDGLLNTATSWLGGKTERKALPQWGNVEEDTDRVAFQQLEIKPTVVPNVVGMGAKDAVFLVESLGLQARIVGVGRVRAQSIPAGNTLVKGQTIQLRLK